MSERLAAAAYRTHLAVPVARPSLAVRHRPHVDARRGYFVDDGVGEAIQQLAAIRLAQHRTQFGRRFDGVERGQHFVNEGATEARGLLFVPTGGRLHLAFGKRPDNEGRVTE